MNKPLKLYRVKPIYEILQDIEIPTCMYKMKNPVARVTDVKKKQTSFNENQLLSNIMDKTPIPELQSIEKKWDSIIDQLSDLKSQVLDIKKTVNNACKLVDYTLVDNEALNNLKVFQGAVINASPLHPPYFLLLIKNLCKSSIPISFSIHIHSNVSSLPDNLNCFKELNKEFNNNNNNNNNALKLYLIWKNDILDTELIISPVKQFPIKGEVNILRYLARSGLDLLQYSKGDIMQTIKADEILDNCHILKHTSTVKERTAILKTLASSLEKHPYFGGNSMNICDVAVWSAIKQLETKVDGDLNSNIKNWYLKINECLKI